MLTIYKTYISIEKCLAISHLHMGETKCQFFYNVQVLSLSPAASFTTVSNFRAFDRAFSAAAFLAGDGSAAAAACASAATGAPPVAQCGVCSATARGAQWQCGGGTV